MRRALSVCVVFLLLFASPASAQTPVAVTILADLDPNSPTGLRTEGLVADGQGRLYTIDTESRRLFRVATANGAVEVLGTLPNPGTGLAFDRSGNLYMASGELVLRIPAASLATPQVDPATVQTIATGLGGVNGLAFDSTGNLFISGGATGNVYRIATDGTVTTPITGLRSDREAQPISANGIQFGADGKLYIANTGTGAIDRIQVFADGTIGPLERVAQGDNLRGADGIVFATNGDLYVAVNERNAIVRVTPSGEITDVTANGNGGPLEFPASPAFVGNDLYVSNFDVARGANDPSDPGIGASIARVAVGIAGVTLPIVPVPTTTAVPTPIPGASGPGPTVTPSPTPTFFLDPSPTSAGPLYAPTSIVTPTATTIGFVPTITTTITISIPTTLPPTPTPIVPVQLPDTGVATPPALPLVVVAMTGIIIGLIVRRTRRR